MYGEHGIVCYNKHPLYTFMSLDKSFIYKTEAELRFCKRNPGCYVRAQHAPEKKKFILLFSYFVFELKRFYQIAAIFDI